jgi:hypothetical protein
MKTNKTPLTSTALPVGLNHDHSKLVSLLALTRSGQVFRITVSIASSLGANGATAIYSLSSPW